MKALIHGSAVVLGFSLLFIVFFSPALLSDHLLAPGDGAIQSLPAFYGSLTLWTPLLLSGYPAAADPQVQSWYPIALLFSQFPKAWNAFVISSYVLASSFAYAYVFFLTHSRLAAFFSGIAYGMSGFMIAHQGHPPIIHSATWFPLLMLALEKLRGSGTGWWISIAALSIACIALSGHPQIFMNCMIVTVAYIAIQGWKADQKKKFYAGTVLAVVLGIGLATIQLLPTIELSRLSVRSEMAFSEFTMYSLPLSQVGQLLFPYLFGGMEDSFYGIPYFGKSNLTELTGYVGWLPILLAAIGVAACRHQLLAWFWGSVGLAAFLVALGDATPLAQLTYGLPVLNMFRAPARHFLEMSLAISVLSGLGVASIQQHHISWRTSWWIASITGITVLSAAFGMTASSDLTEDLYVSFRNPSIGVPLLLFMLSLAVLGIWGSQPCKPWRQWLLVGVLMLDLSSFGWFYEWKYLSPLEEILVAPSTAALYKERLASDKQRMMPIRGALGSRNDVLPNVSRLWEIPSASFYGPLTLTRIKQMLGMQNYGGLDEPWWWEKDQALNIMAVKYISVSEKETKDLYASLGPGCGNHMPTSVNFENVDAPSVSSVEIISSMGCSTAVPDDTEVLRISMDPGQGTIQPLGLKAGGDTSEWAYDCHDVRPLMGHGRAEVFSSFPVTRPSGECQGHKYISHLELPTRQMIKRLTLRWVGPSGAIQVNNIILRDDRHHRSYPVSIRNFLEGSPRWRHVETQGETAIYENIVAMPRAWLVPRVVQAAPDQILHAIKNSKMPDGSLYHPAHVALIEEPFSLDEKKDTRATVEVSLRSDTEIQVRTASQIASFLVLSDVHYPGWRAKIDGRRVHLFQTNYVLRGVMLPAGQHLIDFQFRPRSVYVGMGVALLSLAITVGIALLSTRNSAR